MIVENIKVDITYSCAEELEEIDEEQIERYCSELHIEAAFLWYGPGDYCGDGDMLWTDGKLWYHDSLSHCSCNGPLDDITKGDGVKDPREFCRHASSDLYDELLPLVQAAEQYIIEQDGKAKLTKLHHHLGRVVVKGKAVYPTEKEVETIGGDILL
jgi:hypothetical protein